MKQYETLLIEKKDGIGTLTINRPKSLNALNSQVLQELHDAFIAIDQDKDIHVLIVTGSGEKAFVAGADIKEMKEKHALAGREFSNFGNKVFSLLDNLSQPTIAAVNGFALGGGCELALACDIRIGSENAKFGQPEVGLGIIPGFGGTQRLSRLVGPAKAKELIYTGKVIKSEEAETIGLLNAVVPIEELLDEANKMATMILKQAPLAVKASKEAINRGLEMDLSHALALEAEMFGILFSTEDQKEGMTAFTEKRKATFKNK
ncbi:Short-chain-enoyl-CoA hydratase [Jeotgalibaca dankookensis]|uniref:Short-chain-enoyl-CoA hydratase n=1 Tax=Jeotgalibaca dankookensis TaxID=708126 RepID=A0A1S6IQI1_9LACT|nr:enoyl-CoA hydratase-related protein [Jeotgalibaca dankookensis]AQS53779.1 Short-chain-enoyl-CoA hydratase [Jeotgalibaca dankookensis]